MYTLATANNPKCIIKMKNNQIRRQCRYSRRQRGKIKDVSMALCLNKETERRIFNKNGASGVVGKKIISGDWSC